MDVFYFQCALRYNVDYRLFFVIIIKLYSSGKISTAVHGILLVCRWCLNLNFFCIEIYLKINCYDQLYVIFC